MSRELTNALIPAVSRPSTRACTLSSCTATAATGGRRTSAGAIPCPLVEQDHRAVNVGDRAALAVEALEDIKRPAMR